MNAAADRAVETEAPVLDPPRKAIGASPARARPRRRHRRTLRTIIVSAVLLAACLSWVYPLAWMVASSLKANSQVFNTLNLFPRELYLNNYSRAWTEARVADYFLNTVFITVLSIIITVTVVALFGYVLGRYRFPGKRIIIAVLAIVIFLPEGYTIIPIVELMHFLRLDSSRWGLVLAESGGAHVVMTLLFAGFFSRLPGELEEAAVIDGATFLQVFFKIYLPLAKPIIAVGVILQFLHSWNDFLLPLVVTLSQPSLRTLSVGMYAFQGEEFTDWSGMMAAATISLAPIIVLFLFLQRYFVEGLAGAVKE